MSDFIENTVQAAAIEWLVELGYTHSKGKYLQRERNKVVLEADFTAFLQKSYPMLPPAVLQEALTSFTQQAGMDVHSRNHDFHKKMTKGISLSWKDKTGKEHAQHVYPIDYEQPENNSFLCVDETSMRGKNDRRTDLLIFINGLPLVVFEFKNMFDATVGVDNAHLQLEHYIKDIPQLFDYNALSVISDGIEARHGMYSSSFEWFAPWKSLHGDDIEQDQDLQLQTLIQGLFPKETLLDYIHHFIFHEDHNGKIIKKGAKYHQYWGIKRAVESAAENIQPQGDGRLGVIWHTQGSGKSISMAILTGILRTLPVLKNPTIVIQVDRAALDQQLYENFVLAKDLVGTVEHADNADELRALLSTGGGGVVFTTIEKFRLKDLSDKEGNKTGKELEHPELSTRYNIIVMADEAHRTQYGFKAGGYAQNLRIALPNASFIGFTGTPVDSKEADTELIFGPTIHTYDIEQAVKDGATVPIYYEPKMVPLHIKSDYAHELEAIEEPEDGDRSNAVWAAIEDAAGAKDRVERVAKEILTHFRERTKTLDGKAMAVCMSRRNCVKLYDALTALEGCPEVAIIMTTSPGKDPIAWNVHAHTSAQMKALKNRFKNPDDPLKIVIVRDMWLTGFDAPCAHTMYVDKIMKGHNLMQAIARVNRVFEDKPNGLIVDFIGISNLLATATKKYTTGGGTGKPTFDLEKAVMLCLTQHQNLVDLMGGFEVEALQAMSNSTRLRWSNDLVNALLKTEAESDFFLKEEKKLTELVAMTNSDKRIWEIQESVSVIQKIRQVIRKIKFPPREQRKKNERIKDLISNAIESHAIVDLAQMYDLDNIDISIIDAKFQAMVKEKGSENIKVELLKRIINDEIQVRMLKNIRKMTNLKQELDKVLSKYHKNSLDSIAAIKHLVDLAQEFQQEDKRKQELGLNDDELAFYDLLSSNENILNQEGPIQDLVHKVVDSVKKNLQIDWTKKADAKAAIRLAVKKELKGKVPFSELDNVLKAVIEQAEGYYGDWPMAG